MYPDAMQVYRQSIDTVWVSQLAMQYYKQVVAEETRKKYAWRRQYAVAAIR